MNDGRRDRQSAGKKRVSITAFALLGSLLVVHCIAAEPMKSTFAGLALDYTTPLDPVLQAKLETIDAGLRGRHGMSSDQTAAGVLDLRTQRLAMVRPDRIDYARVCRRSRFCSRGFNRIRKRRPLSTRKRGTNSV
jgi:hypothetical protein